MIIATYDVSIVQKIDSRKHDQKLTNMCQLGFCFRHVKSFVSSISWLYNRNVNLYCDINFNHMTKL